MLVKIGNKEYNDPVKISTSEGKSYEIPLRDYLEQTAFGMGYDSYKELYRSGGRIIGYENLNPEDLDSLEKEKTKNYIDSLKENLLNKNLIINRNSVIKDTFRNGNYVYSIFCGELQNGNFFITDKNENLFTTKNSYEDYYNFSTKDIDINKMINLKSYDKEDSQLLIDYLFESEEYIIFKANIEQNKDSSITNQTQQKLFKNEPKNDINYSKYQKLFNDYCKNRTKDLGIAKDNKGNQYLVFLKGLIDNQECSIVYIKDKENMLNYITPDGELKTILNNNPNIYACDMKFTSINPNFKDGINEYWNRLNLDEIMETYEELANQLNGYENKIK